MRPRTRLLLSAGAAVLAVSIARGEERNLRPNYDYVVEVNGVMDKEWKIHSGQNRTRMLLTSPPADLVLLVSVSEKSVRPVDRKLVKANSNGTLDVLAGAVSSTRIIPLSASGSTASFSLDGRTISLKPRPPLLGPHTVTDLVADRPSFGEEMDSYQPEAAVVSFFKVYAKPTEIEIFFGSWCSVCELWVPKLLKAVQTAGNSKIRVSLIGVARDFTTDQELAKRKGVRGLPTFIIRQGGIEVGRIVGAPEKGTVEAAISEVLKAKS